MSSELKPLLHSTSGSPPLTATCCIPQQHCLSSKAAILIILWTAVTGVVYTFTTDVVALLINTSKYTSTVDVAVLELIPHVVTATVMIFYPLSGFIADVCCGRFKTVMISVGFMLLSFVLLSVACFIAAQVVASETIIQHNNVISNGKYPTFLVLITLFLMCFIIGLAGYQANYIQFGLDQLLDAPSEYLGLFIHVATWVFSISSIIDLLLFSIGICTFTRRTLILSSLIIIPTTLTILLLTLYIVGCWKRHDWFYSEPAQHNPYKTVFSVLNFARKHKHPIQRSAFTYSDSHIPTRLDFAKQRFGGPFTTDQVESVKALVQILLLLLAVGPTYILQVPASQYVFPLFAYHTGAMQKHHSVRNCSVNIVLMEAIKNGGLAAALTDILFPLYIWITFSVLRRKLPKILSRLGLGILLSLLGVLAMLIIDVVGHSMNKNEEEINNGSKCMFQVIKHNYTLGYEPLNMHWSVLVLPSLFFGIGPLMITTTTLEFISAQSPYSMKGLLVGVFFLIQGFLQLLGITVILPLSLTQPWTSSPVVSCGFVYLLFILMTGLIGLLLFIVTAKKYKYRERDDQNFYQRDIEEIYTRYLTQTTSTTADKSNVNNT